ncbi:MAG TPA: palindromic element RPE1 domain-containing protein [Rickettsia endosymbiont of Proechinophthirus fluctus]|nr:palindromic element RPE1 domain-containing protein [Rickettsia endosymbiont of Proechinophthirus fluctus]HJD55053.1 palindromic element RPE1 domain-containing protein [Rickettsia endosymbiont of Proechinophthirus fluctus]
MRPLPKPTYREAFNGDTGQSTTAYIEIREDTSTESTYKLSLKTTLGKRSIENYYI